MSTMISRIFLATFVALGFSAGAAHAQEAAAELLQRVPDNFGFCLVINDLAGQSERWTKAPWFAKLRENPLVRGVLDGKEVGDLLRLEQEVKKRVDLDFAFLFEEILGHAVVLAYQPPAKGQPSSEKGLLLIKTRKAETIADFVEKVNQLQSNLGELTSLEDRKYKNQAYYRRVHQNATHFYFVKDATLAISNHEDVIQNLLDRDTKAASARRDQWLSARLTKSVATLWINPRTFDAEFVHQAKNKTGPEGAALQSIVAFWQGLDGLFVSVQGDDAPELRLTLLARPGTPAAKAWNTPPAPPAELWRRFPENALLSGAFTVDFAKALKKLKDSLSEKDAGIELLVQKNLAAATGLDVYREMLPNLGPDIGFALTLPEGASLPRGLVALAVQSAPKEAPVDQTLLKAANLFLGLAIFDYNRKNTDPIRVRTLQQDGVEVKFLDQDKIFPSSVQPALALKEGYLLVGSSPDAIADFRADRSPAAASAETPLLKMAPREWSRLMKAQRQAMIDHLVKKHRDTPAAAANVVDGIAAGLELFQSLNLTQRAAAGQSAWTLRLTPAK
jgi:hypothetical protein